MTRAALRTLSFLAIAALPSCTRGGDPQEPTGAYSAVVESGVRYEADTRVMESFPVQLATTVTAINTTGRRVELTFPDGCVVLLRAYSDSGRTQRVWDQGEQVGCTMALVEWDLAPGEEITATARTDAAQILRDALPDGEYWLEALLRPEGRAVTVPAGAVDLAVPRD